MHQVRMLDAFAGIGGFHIGVEQACQQLGIGFECVGAIEFDKQARNTYRSNFSSVEMFDAVSGDITKISLSDIPQHNLLCGGFPCQPFSQAGNAHIHNDGKLLDTDSRTHLYQYLIDILHNNRPEYFIFENVEGLTRIMYGSVRLIDHIIGLIPKGYTTQLLELSPHQIGIPQIRKRIFIIGSLRSEALSIHLSHVNSAALSTVLDSNVSDSYYIEQLWSGHYLQQQPNKTKVEALFDSLRYRQNKYPTATNQTKQKTVLAAEINGDTPNGRSRQRDRAYHINGMCPTLNCTDKKIIYRNGRFRALTEIECARLQGFPQSFQINPNQHAAYRQFGNAVCAKVVYEISKCLLS